VGEGAAGREEGEGRGKGVLALEQVLQQVEEAGAGVADARILGPPLPPTGPGKQRNRGRPRELLALASEPFEGERGDRRGAERASE